MKLLMMQSGEHQCLLYSIAMLLGDKPAALQKELGHKGNETWWPELSIPYCYNGYHIQEIIDLCLTRGRVLVPIELFPVSAPMNERQNVKMIYDYEHAVKRFTNHLLGNRGLLITENHACAWDGKRVFDPNGRTARLEDYRIKECWLYF